MLIAALLACHNRRAKTLACLAALEKQDLPEGFSLKVFLVDDGSTDGTSDAVREAFPGVEIIAGNGGLFWGGGMGLAWEAASSHSPGLILWVNDDTTLFDGALHRLLIHFGQAPDDTKMQTIWVGATCDPLLQKTTYGGICRGSGLFRFRFTLVGDSPSAPIACVTFNGNCVLIPSSLAESLGRLNSDLRHAMGDFDFGLRASRAGARVIQIPGWVGICERNSLIQTWQDSALPILQRWRSMRSPKGLPARDWWVLTRAHGGTFFFFFWLWPYFRFWSEACLSWLTGSRLGKRQIQ